MKKHLMLIALLLAVFLLLPQGVQAQEAQNITATTTISGSGYGSFTFLQDSNIDSYLSSDGSCAITLENPEGIASIYLYFDLEYGTYTITDRDTGASITAGSYGILHDFVDLQAGFGKVPTAVTLHFDSGSVRLSEIYSFTEGETPDFVQKWTAPLEDGADIVLFSTHSDDDQLFFAGLVPLYAGEKGCRVQVVLMTDHREGAFATYARTHEVLNGLWATGLTAYPVFGDFLDYRLDDIQAMYQYYADRGVTREDIQGFVVEQLRRFKPLVAIGHDFGGEYGHGMHKIYAEMLASGITLAADPNSYPETAETYGTWQPQKTYLHLYAENQIVLDYDQPLAHFGGLTAFQVSQQLGYPCHHSQRWTWFTQWINGNNGEITSVTQIQEYNPAYFGLYQTTVGPDVQKNDFLENIITYAQQDAAAAASVDAQIGALEEISLESQEAIQAARAAYDALTASQKALVTDLKTLEAAETALAEQVQQQAVDGEKAAQVVAQIDGLGTITLESQEALETVQAAFDALTDNQKAMVTNRQTLENAQEKLELLQQEMAWKAQVAQKKQAQKELLTAVGVLGILILTVVVLVITIRRKKR